MQVPGGQVNPGLSFFRAVQGLVQRPNQAGESAQAQSAASPTDRVSPQQRFASEATTAARPADPSLETGRPGESARNALESIDSTSERQTVGGGRFVPRGTILDLRV